MSRQIVCCVERPFDPSTFSQNQKRLIPQEVADLFFHEVAELAGAQSWISSENCTVEAALIEA